MINRSLICCLLLLLVTNSVFAEEFDYSRKDFQEIVAMLDMEGHGNDDLATCNVKQLYYKEVASMMEKGMKKDEILHFYVEQMGEGALKAPLKHGFSLAAWITPYVIFILAAIVVYFIINRMIKSKNNQLNQNTNVSKISEEENDALLDLIELERKKYF